LIFFGLGVQGHLHIPQLEGGLFDLWVLVLPKWDFLKKSDIESVEFGKALNVGHE